ncbi:hypothetical protein [Candidatus Lokiarchaeum ossiferum]|uniref:hypothetical protein n=1 Tax=Candidatus Lokiarchaeum ossiferum TaxID=2951803 RepID=UPI00352F6B89
MTVLEVGIFENSLLVLSKSFYPLKKAQKTLNIQKRSHIINSIQKMSKVVLKGEVEMLDNDNYRIIFQIPSPKSRSNIFLYAIDDRKSSKNIISSLLDELFHKFELRYPASFPSNIMVVDRYQQFLGTIDDVFSDECYTPSDRVRNYLF